MNGQDVSRPARRKYSIHRLRTVRGRCHERDLAVIIDLECRS